MSLDHAFLMIRNGLRPLAHHKSTCIKTETTANPCRSPALLEAHGVMSKAQKVA